MSATAEQTLENVWDTVETVRVAMMATHRADDWHARPMMGSADRDQGAIWFMSDRESSQVFEADDDDRVLLTYVDSDRHRYASIYGRVELSHDAGKIRELWSPWADLFFPDGPTDPSVILLRVVPDSAEYWTGPSRRDMTKLAIASETSGSSAKAAAAQIGEHGEVRMNGTPPR